MFVTEIDTNIKGDAFFLDFNKDDWKIVYSEKHKKDLNNDNDYNFIIYKKKGK